MEKIELVSKNAVFFFRRRKKKQPFEIESVSAFQTFPGKKKTTFEKKKNRTKISKMGKKWEIGSLVPWSFSKNAYYTAFLKSLWLQEPQILLLQ